MAFRSLKGTLLLVALVTAAAKAPNPSPKPYSECDEPGDEFFYLVQQWPPGFCAAEDCRAGLKPPTRFTLHGLWPNYCQDVPGKDYPESCSREKLDMGNLSRLLPALKSDWPSFSSKGNEWFWEHEWDRHGTCALAYTPFGLNSQHEYFETALELHSSSNLHERLSSQGIEPGSTVSQQDLHKALEAALGVAAYLHCEKNILVEIYLCYNQQLELVSCSKGGSCSSKSNIRYLAGEVE